MENPCEIGQGLDLTTMTCCGMVPDEAGLMFNVETGTCETVPVGDCRLYTHPTPEGFCEGDQCTVL